MRPFMIAFMLDTPLPPPPPPSPDWALFLDVDGSILDFAATPDAVHVPDGLVDALGRLSDALGGALALVSGRPLEQLDALFAPLRLPGAGLHGLQVRDDASPGAAAIDAPPALAQLAAQAHAIAAQYPGALVEDKGCTLALHWRNAPEAAPAFHALAANALELLPHYRPQPGQQVLELRPDGFDKGGAIRHLMQRAPFAGRCPVFVGDDLTDEHGFIAVNALSGLSVIVGDRRPTDATHRLTAPQALRDWLHAAARSQHPYKEASA